MNAEMTVLRTRLATGPSVHYLTAGLAFASELIHLWQLPDEFIIWPLRGIFFLLVAMAQGALAVNLLFDPRRWTLRLGIVLNVFIILVWAFTRLVGVPGWIVFVRQPVDAAGIAAMAIGVVLIALLVTMRRALRAESARAQRHALNPDSV